MLTEILWLVIGIALGGAGVGVVVLLKRGGVQQELSNARSRAAMLDEQIARANEDIEKLRADMASVDDAREQAERAAAIAREQLKAREQAFAEQKKLLEDAEKKLRETFESAGANALRQNSEQFFSMAKKTFEGLLQQAKGEDEKTKQAIHNLVKPIHELLDKHNTAVGELEKKREVAYKSLEKHIEFIAQSHEKLGSETRKLVSALRRPEQRGRWGEMQLRNACELAGMTEYCDFEEQVQTDDPSTRDRPDMTINLPGGAKIVVDAKVALDAYLDALQPDADRAAQVRRHADQVEKHYKALAAKKYWDQFEKAPKLVVMFMPLESALVAALEAKPNLHAEAMQNHVLIATPTLLVALLRAIAYGWQQEALAENAREISKVGRELYDRLATFVGHFEKVGKNLDQSMRAYNGAVGSLERMVLSSTRKLKELHVSTEDDIEGPEPVDLDIREFTAAELKSLPLDAATGDEERDV